MNNNFLLVRFLSGFSNTLKIANQIIPLYKETKPLVSNIKNTYKLLKNNNVLKQTNKIIENKKIITNTSNNPQFFI
jgi:hypothetical protein